MTTKTFVFYDQSGGIVKYESSVADEPAPYPPYNWVVTDKSDVSGFRVDTSTLELVPRYEFQFTQDTEYVMADGLDDVTFNGIPAGTIIEFTTVDGFMRAQIDDGSLILTFDLPQSVRIKFRHPAYHTAWRTVHAY